MKLEICQLLQALLNSPHRAVVGVGNCDYGDDGAGLTLAQSLADAGLPGVHLAGNAPEHWLPRLAQEGFSPLLLLDAVDFGGMPGSVVWLDGHEIKNRFPQVSTHKISLGALASLVENAHGTRMLLLGIQPASLKAGEGLSPIVQVTLQALQELMLSLTDKERPLRAGKPCLMNDD